MLKYHILVLFLVLMTLFFGEIIAESSNSISENVVNEEVHVGVILDMGSLEGEIVHSCITMAVSDFYALNPHHKTKITIHTRDSKQDPFVAISSAHDLFDNIKVKAILGPETHQEAKLLGLLGDKVQIPTISFSPSHTTSHPSDFQITRDETIQFKGIEALIDSFKWRNAILLYEDTDYGRDILPFFASNVHRFVHMVPVSPNDVNKQIFDELHRLMAKENSVFVVHASSAVATRIFLEANNLGMISSGYVWIVTDRAMSYLDSSMIISMQGVLGIRAYIPPSRELRRFTSRFKRKFYSENAKIETDQEPDQTCLLAYDTVWSLAKAVEKVGTESSNFSMLLVNEVLQTKFRGLRGEFQTSNGKLVSGELEVVNLIGRAERTVGFWTLKGGFVKEISNLSNTAPNITGGLETIIWPGGSVNTPRGWFIKRLSIIVPMKNDTWSSLVEVQHHPQTNSTTFTGFCIEVFKAAIERLKYEVPYDFVPLEGWRSYQDMIDEVYFQKYDAAVGDITILSNRSLYVDFTSPYTDLGIGTVVRIVDKKSLWLFLEPLDRPLWLTTAAFFILTGFVVWKIEHPINKAFQGSPSQQIGTTFLFAFSTLVFAHREKLFSNLSRFVVIVWVFVVLIITSSYTATLSSMLTVQQIEQASKKGYNVGYQAGSFVGGDVVNNVNFNDPHPKLFGSPEEFDEALSKGGRNGGIDAIVDEMPYIKIFLGQFPDNHALVATESNTSGFGFVFQKESPLVADISTAIMQLREEGILELMEHKWFKTKTSSTPSASETSNTKTLKFDYFRGLFIITGTSLTLALVVYHFYWLREQWTTRVENIVRAVIRLLMRYSTGRYHHNLT